MASDEAELGHMLTPFFSTDSLEGHSKDGHFHSVLSGVQVGKAELMAIRNSAMSCSGDVRQGVSLVLAYDWPGLFTVDGSSYEVAERPFLLPQGPYAYRSDEVQGVVLGLNPAELVRVAAAMTGDHSNAVRQRIETLLQQPLLLNLEHPRSRMHLNALKHTLWVLDEALRSGIGVSPMLALDDLLARLTLLLIWPDLDQAAEDNATKPVLPAATNSSGRGAARSLNALIDWILADLQQPIALSDLEQRSGYSRRTLQKAFHERFGMGPMQWVRRQRLNQAKQLVLSSGSTLKLRAIAQACGYANPAGFSRDFHQVFGVRPSDLARASRSDKAP
jgi:AraC-like DNA-binding protein